MAKANSKTKKTSRQKKSEIEQLGGRIPPHNLPIERALLCSALIDPEGFGKIVDIIDTDSFYDRRHSLIFNGMSRLFSTASPIDALTVSEELEKAGDLESAGGDPYLAGLTNEVATSTHIEHYAKVIQEKATLRRLISTSTSIAYDAYETEDPDDLFERAMREYFEIFSHRQRGGFQPIRDVLTITHEYLDKIHKQEGKLTGVGTGFTKLDEYTSGFQPGDLVIIAGRPSMGKTALSLDLARNACVRNNIPAAFFSLEMASMAIALRLVASEARLNLHKLRSGKLRDTEWQKLSRATGMLSETNLFIDDTGTLGLMELRARARRLKQQHDIGIIFVDYLQLMKPPKADSREQEVAQISRALKGLARELDIPVVAMSQLSRAVEQRGGDKRPQLADLRDSGAIEQDADVVMFIFRQQLYKTESDEDKEIDNTAEIIIRKQRNGPTGTVKLTFNPDFTRFEEHEHESTAASAPTSKDVDEEPIPF